MSIKNDLLNLIISNGYDTNDSNVKNALLSIINDNNATNISNEKSILVRILSINEYKKYIENSSLDGAITVENENTWHLLNYNNRFTSNSSFASGYTVASYIDNQYWGGSPGQYIARYSASSNIFYMLTQENNLSNDMSKYKNDIIFYWVGRYGNSDNNWWSGGLTYTSSSYSNTITSNKDKTINYISVTLGRTREYRSDCLFLTVNQINSFRPIFSYIDNRKSNSIFN